MAERLEEVAATGDRIVPQNIRDALALIRAAVEDCAPAGSAANSEYLPPEPSHNGEAVVRAIYAVAERER